MDPLSLNRMPQWQPLKEAANRINRPENHLKHLIETKGRINMFSVKGGGLFYDFSRQRVDNEVMSLLFDLAQARDLKRKIKAMADGEIVNVTENRAALHTATRDFSRKEILVNGRNIVPEINEQRDLMKRFSEQIRSGSVTGSTGKPFKNIVVTGIGGSYLGTQFVSTALSAYAEKNIELYYLSNVDIHHFGQIVSHIDPEQTLWIIISKSYTTPETLANTAQAYAYIQSKGLDPSKHIVTVTAKGSPGDNPGNPVLQSFNMFDYIGGRYSVTSAVGGVPLSIYLGYDKFEEFLYGAEDMDQHAITASVSENLPLISALISVWNNNFLHYPAQGIIPYASLLEKLPSHIQQLNMESNGKSVLETGEPTREATGTIIFGEPGTNAQHSFFQLAHQGRPFPIDFIGVVNPLYTHYTEKSMGVTHHQELWANFISQPMALAAGKTDKDPAKTFTGNRPSSTILLKDLSPRNIGRLLSFYEAKTVFEAFIWGINPFDQFGVELGKTMASGIRKQMAMKNENPGHTFDSTDPISRYYLDILFSGEM